VNETRPYGFIVKPFKPIDVVTTVSVVLNNAQHRKIDVARTEEEPSSEIPYILKNVVQYINEHIHEKITVAELTQMTKWKSQHFQRVFTQFIGMNPNEYIKIKKIEKAKAMLVETDQSICDIVDDLGYKSQSNFFTLFKTLTGMSPESYRIRYKYKIKI
jgi:AraC-like DNA-binding protein